MLAGQKHSKKKRQTPSVDKKHFKAHISSHGTAKKPKQPSSGGKPLTKLNKITKKTSPRLTMCTLSSQKTNNRNGSLIFQDGNQDDPFSQYYYNSHVLEPISKQNRQKKYIPYVHTQMSQKSQKNKNINKIKSLDYLGLIDIDGKIRSLSKSKHSINHKNQHQSLTSIINKSNQKSYNKKFKKVRKNKSKELLIKDKEIKQSSQKQLKKVKCVRQKRQSHGEKNKIVIQNKQDSFKPKEVTEQTEHQSNIITQQKLPNFSNQQIIQKTAAIVQQLNQSLKEYQQTRQMKLENIEKHYIRAMHIYNQLVQQLQITSSTYWLAIRYFQLYLSKNFKEKIDIELVLISCLYIAIKIDNIEKVGVFQSEVNHHEQFGMTLGQQNQNFSDLLFGSMKVNLQTIYQQQINICTSLNYHLHYNCLDFYLHKIIFELWNNFIQNKQFKKMEDNYLNHSYDNFYFNWRDSKIYNLQRLLTLLYLKPCFQWEPLIICSLLFLVIRITAEKVRNKTRSYNSILQFYQKSISKDSNIIFIDHLGINELFCQFLQMINIKFLELANQVHYNAWILNFGWQKHSQDPTMTFNKNRSLKNSELFQFHEVVTKLQQDHNITPSGLDRGSD